MDYLCSIVKVRLRIKSAAFDDAEIRPLIEACLKDLARVGIAEASEEDPLVVQAVVLYCKANFGFSDGQERYQAAYESLRDSMALSGDYGGDGNDVS